MATTRQPSHRTTTSSSLAVRKSPKPPPITGSPDRIISKLPPITSSPDRTIMKLPPSTPNYLKSTASSTAIDTGRHGKPASASGLLARNPASKLPLPSPSSSPSHRMPVSKAPKSPSPSPRTSVSPQRSTDHKPSARTTASITRAPSFTRGKNPAGTAIPTVKRRGHAGAASPTSKYSSSDASNAYASEASSIKSETEEITKESNSEFEETMASVRRGERPKSNEVIEEFRSKMMEKKKNKVLALVGAFETVMSMQDTPAAGQQQAAPSCDGGDKKGKKKSTEST